MDSVGKMSALKEEYGNSGLRTALKTKCMRMFALLLSKPQEDPCKLHTLLASTLAAVVSLRLNLAPQLQPQSGLCEGTVSQWDQFWLLHHLFAQQAAFTAGLREFMDC